MYSSISLMELECDCVRQTPKQVYTQSSTSASALHGVSKKPRAAKLPASRRRAAELSSCRAAAELQPNYSRRGRRAAARVVGPGGGWERGRTRRRPSFTMPLQGAVLHVSPPQPPPHPPPPLLPQLPPHATCTRALGGAPASLPLPGVMVRGSSVAVPFQRRAGSVTKRWVA